MTKPRSDTVGFIGLGKMGEGMARNLLEKGHSLVVYDVVEAKNRLFAGMGATVGKGPADVARQAAIVITMVDTTEQSFDVITRKGGILDTAQSGDTVICMSTIDPLAVREMHDILAAKGIGMIDSPVTGMIKGANEGRLNAYVGGDVEVLDRVRHVLEGMTKEINHAGGIGQGLAIKLINNMLYHVTSIAAIEALVLGAKAGIAPEVMKDVIGRSTGNSPAFQYRADRIIRRDWDGPRLDISIKDMELELSLGKAFGVPLHMPAAALQVFRMGAAHGMGSDDASKIVELYEYICQTRVGGEAG